MKHKFSILLVAFLFLFSCKKIELNRIDKITTDDVVINNTAINATGTIIDIGKEGITKYGHCWSVNAVPTINDAKTEFTNAEAGKVFVSAITAISASTVYYVCAYATNGSETVYGAIKSFTLSGLNALAVTTTAYQIQSESTVWVSGSIVNLGALSALDYGHCWATHTAPTVSDNKSSNSTLNSDINFGTTISNLNQETTYFVRSYIKLNSTTIIYGNELNFIIPDLIVTTDNHSVSGTTASLQGTIVSLGVLPVTDHGMCWSTTTSNPNFNDNVISQGAASAIGQYYSNLTGLVTGITYYFRAYARKGNTIKYGVVKSFTY